MERSQMVQAVTLLLAATAAVCSFVAMRAAVDARHEARIAGELASSNDRHSQGVWELHEALVRAGVIDDLTGRFDHLDEGSG